LFVRATSIDKSIMRRENIMRARIIALTTLFTSTVAASAAAEGFSLNRFDPAERGSEWFVQDTLDLRGHLRPAIGVTGDWAHKPLVSYAPDGSERTAVVKDQVFVHVGASMVLVDRIRFGLNLPVAVFQQGTTATLNGVTYSPAEKTTLGDVRLGGDVRLVGEYGSPFTLAFGVQVFVPTGTRSQWTGDGRVRVVPRLQAAGDIGPFVYAARIGAAYRALEEDFAGSKVGSELTFGASAGARLLDKSLVIGPEIFGTTVFNDAFMRKSTPFELIFGAHYTIEKDLRVGAGIGPGLTRGFGAPQFRALLSVEWAPAFEEEKKPLPVTPPPPPAPKDDDADGIINEKDACPTVPGVANPDPKKNGCPSDKDNDGIYDTDDACPELAGIKSDDPKKNGCPPDGDNDGIYDVDDACPTVAGVKSEDPKKNGCPPDKDGDGIIDPEDACPEVPGPKNEDPKKNGCPAAAIVGNKIQIWQQVKFKTNSAEILKESDEILSVVAKIMTEHPEIKKIRIDGHTDNKGAKAYNKTLSKNRAASVMKWMTTKGKIDKKRLDSAGFGDEQPIDSNDTDEGRQNNRRVEFTLITVDKPTEPAKTPSP
jgi:OmpA-OmpF porin, OOP family